MELNNQDINNILVIINSATITGQQAETVAILKQKLSKMMLPTETAVEKPKE